REGRDLRPEAGGRLRLCVALFLRERSLDRGAFRGDLGNVARRHLLEEVRAVGDTNPRGSLRRPRARPEVEAQQRKREDDPRDADAWSAWVPLRFRGRRRSWRARRRPLVPTARVLVRNARQESVAVTGKSGVVPPGVSTRRATAMLLGNSHHR